MEKKENDLRFLIFFFFLGGVKAPPQCLRFFLRLHWIPIVISVTEYNTSTTFYLFTPSNKPKTSSLQINDFFFKKKEYENKIVFHSLSQRLFSVSLTNFCISHKLQPLISKVNEIKTKTETIQSFKQTQKMNHSKNSKI